MDMGRGRRWTGVGGVADGKDEQGLGEGEENGWTVTMECLCTSVSLCVSKTHFY